MVDDPNRYNSQLYSSFTRRWLSLSIKLPRSLVVFFRLYLLPVFAVVVLSFFEVTPAIQNETVARNKAAMAAHMKPKAYWPRVAVWPLAMKLFRPITYAALDEISRAQFRNQGILTS